MTKRHVSEIDSEFAGVEAALKRAAANALQLGLQTNTPVWVIRDGVMLDLVAERRGIAPTKVGKARSTMSRKHST